MKALYRDGQLFIFAEASKKCLERVSKTCLVSGHDFSRAEKGLRNKGF
jgi:hypothetical protein